MPDTSLGRTGGADHDEKVTSRSPGTALPRRGRALGRGGASRRTGAGPGHGYAVLRHPPEGITTSLEGCLPENLFGTGTLTETSTGQVVDTGKVFTVRGVNEYDLHLVFPDGSYVQSGLNRDRYVFVANGPLTVYNVVTQDFRTIYAADGTPIGTLSIHAGMHITYRDLNGNGMPDPGEITAEFEYFRLRCG
jgi:hypothetical protein